MRETPAPARDTLPYRLSAGIMLLNERKLVFAGRRLDMSVESWQMPQGGIDEGEDPLKAAFREMGEEIGTDKAELIREHPDWLYYDLPDHLLGTALHGRYRGQKQRWFAMRFTGHDEDIDLMTHEPEFAEWKWVEAEALLDMIVPFKREVYRQVLDAFADLI